MATTYSFTISTRFPGGINIVQLHDEIVANVTITTALVGIRGDFGADNVDITFVVALPGPEFTELDTVVIPGHVDIETPNMLFVGSIVGASATTIRWGTSGFRKCQFVHTSLADADVTLTITQLKSEILIITPTVDRTLTLPTAALAVGGLPEIAVDDAIYVTIINKSSAANEAIVTVAIGAGGTLEGSDDVHPAANNAGTYFTPGSGMFVMRFTNVTASSEAYTVYRIG